jgi:hypothetical protein
MRANAVHQSAASASYICSFSRERFLNKLDIAEEMAKSGTACDWPKFSGGHYKVSEKPVRGVGAA